MRQKALLALEAGLNPVHVVTGAYGSQVAAVLDDLPITLVDNPHWQHGQSTSVKAAVQSFPSETGGAIFFLADQLSFSLDLVNSLIRAHAATLSPMVVTLCQGQRATPILFDRQIFPDLLGLSGDVGGRALLSEYSPTWVAWDDPELLVDVDTPADYEKYIGAGK